MNLLAIIILLLLIVGSGLTLKEGMINKYNNNNKCYKADGSIVPYTRPDDNINKCGGLHGGTNVKWVDQNGCCNMIRLTAGEPDAKEPDAGEPDAGEPTGYFKSIPTKKLNNPLNSALYISACETDVNIPVYSWNEIWVPPPPQITDKNILNTFTQPMSLDFNEAPNTPKRLNSLWAI